MHAVWKTILDDDFIHAYTYGIVIKCIDGIERRVYPRLFTYSADYPEKFDNAPYDYFLRLTILQTRVLLATIRDKGICPCPRCLILKAKLDKLGLRRDIMVRVNKFRVYMAEKVALARKAIYESAKPINGAAVEGLLKEFSGVPTQVCIFLNNVVLYLFNYSTRMPLLNNLVKTSIPQRCLLLTSCTSLSSAYGKPYLHT